MRRLLRSIAVATAILAAGIPAYGVRLEFIAQYHGARVTGAEVCFFGAGEPDDAPLERFLGSDDVRCLPADAVIDLTPGRWNYYLRDLDKYLVSAFPATLTNNAPELAERGYKQIVDEVRPAGVIDVADLRSHVPGDERLGIYTANEGTDFPPALLPIPRTENRILVPAESTVVLLGVREGMMVDVAEPVKVRRSAVRTIDAFPDRADSPVLVSWMVFTRDGRTPGEFWSGIPAPTVTLTTAGRERRPVVPVRPSYGSDQALLLFRDVRRGAWTLRVAGTGWRPDQLSGERGSESVVNTSRPLVTAPMASLKVRVSISSQPPDGVSCVANTPDGARSRSEHEFVLLACPSLQPGLDASLVNRRICRNAALPSSVDPAEHTAMFDAVAPGTYILEVQESGFSPVRRTVSLPIGKTLTVDVPVRSFDFFGRLTYAGRPASVGLKFATGIATTDADGRYTARLDGPPGDLPVKVIDCNSGKTIAIHVPASSIPENQPYDIAIAANTLRVRVSDARDGAPVPGATVQVGVLTDVETGAGHFFEGVPRSGGEGETSTANVPTDQPLLVCAQADGFERSCGEAFTMGGEAEHTYRIALSRKDVKRGRVHAAAPFGKGWIAFVSPVGKVLETADLDPDGSFTCAQDHAAPEYVVVVSANLPLAVVNLTNASPAPPDFAMPDGAVRDVEIVIGPNNAQNGAVIGIFIGGRYVPDQALLRHQMWRGLQTGIAAKGPLRVPAVAATAPIEVVLGPAPSDLPRETIEDVFLRPDLVTGRPKETVPASGIVVFE